ncbi:hypothetical protein BDV23DRAFT_154720, partial [Aspergillus alliaceus]
MAVRPFPLYERPTPGYKVVSTERVSCSLGLLVITLPLVALTRGMIHGSSSSKLSDPLCLCRARTNRRAWRSCGLCRGLLNL